MIELYRLRWVENIIDFLLICIFYKIILDMEKFWDFLYYQQLQNEIAEYEFSPLERHAYEMELKECAAFILKTTEKNSRFFKVYVLTNVIISSA